MTWVKLDDGFDINDKQLRASDAAVRVWVCSMTFCARQREPTGFMTKAQAQQFVRGLGKKPTIIAELVRLNAWEELPDGYLVHDFEVYLPKSSTERVRAWRAAKRAGQDPEPTPPTGTPNGTAGNTDVTRYAPVTQRDETLGNADETVSLSRGRPRSRGGIPVSRIPYTQTPPTSESPPQPPQWGDGESGDLLAEYLGFLGALSQATGVPWREEGLSRTRYLERRQEGFTAADLDDAARGVALDPWFMGRNGDGVPKCDPSTVLKSPKLQTFIGLARGQIAARGSGPAQFDAFADAVEAGVEQPLRLVEGGSA